MAAIFKWTIVYFCHNIGLTYGKIHLYAEFNEDTLIYY